ncbi:hypothetical protein [Paraflavitalea sp. CAU 1676]|uniref:hypothetical protein n=1 Tax=Paraflavitalea sp. CAU 1676 TaxID=3032598 RepID=UPI0023D9D626|nr:hypothetical protein [Paraflavitalea sp. CAU 1676]MDF2193180.1 hypothetical protein [Paraflavitalea sp. CAU 1676]
MRVKSVLYYLLSGAIGWTSCDKDDAQTPADPTPGDTEITVQVTPVAGSETEYGSTTDVAPLNARFFGITKLALDTRDNKTALYLIDQSDADLRIVEGNKVRTVSNIMGVYALAQSICLAPGGAGKVYITSGYGQLVLFDVNLPYEWGVNPKVIIDRNAVNGTRTGVGGTRGIAVDANGDIFLGNAYVNAVTKVNNSSHTITAFAGVPLPDQANETPPFADGDALTKAVFGNVSDVCINKAGKLYVADRLYRTIREIDGGKVKALFTPSPYPYENYIQPSVDGALKDAKSAMISYVAVPQDNSNRIFFCTSGGLRLILLDEQRVITLKQFPQGIHGMAVAADGKTVYIASGYGVVKVALSK